MKKKSPILCLLLTITLAGCATFQSVVKSTFPYTATLVIPQSTPVHADQSVYGDASSFDQTFKKDNDTSARVRDVRIVSAKLESKDPSDFNIGNLVYAKVYLSKPDGSEEVLVASRTDITPGTGSSIVLDINTGIILDKFVHKPKIKARLIYQLRNHIDVTANLRLVLGVSASPAQ